MRTGPFSVSTDGSNDADSKQYPLVIRSLDPASGLVNSELLCVPICSGSSTGENIFLLMNKELESRNIPWENCLSLGCDNASVMTGHKKGVFAYVKEKQPSVFLSGCALHLVHIGAKKAATALPPIDDLLIDIYYYFNKSDKRKAEFKGTQDMYDTQQKKMLKHVCTRWLSIARCLERLLHNLEALKAYFKTQKDLLSNKRKKPTKISTKKTKSNSDQKDDDSYLPLSYAEQKVDAIFHMLRSPTNKLYMVFLNYTVHVYDEVLKNLQAEDPQIHVLRRSLHCLLRKILIRFVKPPLLLGKALDQVNYSKKTNQVSNEDLIIGEEAKSLLAEKEKNHLREKRIVEFYDNVRLYFCKACDYLKQKLPLNDPLLKHAEVADISLQLTAKVSDLCYFLDRFPCLLPGGVSKDSIREEFVLYQSSDVTKCISDRIDATWNAVGKMKDGSGNILFRNLSDVMCGILCIPHSSAHCERVFSTVRKNRTDQRACLSDNTLESLLVLKSRPGHPHDSLRQHSSDTLDYLRGAYYRHLQ